MPSNTPEKKPQTVAEVKTSLESLSLPIPDREGLSAISRLEGDRFLEALESAVKQANSGAEPDQLQLDYLANIVTAAHADTRAIVEDAGFQFDIALVMEVAKREGRSFREAMRQAKSGNAQGEIEAARSFLINLLEQYGAVSHGFFSMAEGAPVIEFEQNDRQPSPRYNPDPGSSKPPEPASSRAGSAPATSETKLFGKSVHVFAGKAALCVAETVTPVGEKHTITFEVAQLLPTGKANWQNKVALMLTVPEQVLVLGVLRGFMQKVDLKGHGTQKEKAMTIVNQGNQFFLTMIKRGQSPRAIPIPAAYAYPITTMLQHQMQKNDPHLSIEMIERIASHLCAMHDCDEKQTGANRG